MKEAEFGWKTTDTPSILAFNNDVPNPIQQVIIQTINAHYPITAPYTLKSLEATTDSPIGRYKLSQQATLVGHHGTSEIIRSEKPINKRESQLIKKDNEVFVRVTSKIGLPVLEQEITQYLVDADISINPIILAGIDLMWHDTQLRLDIRPLVTGAHFNYSVDEFRSLCLTLHDCHQALKDFPLKEAIKAQAKSRFSKMYRYFESIIPKLAEVHAELFPEHHTWAKNNIDCFQRMTAEFNPNFHLVDDAQCLHGEIHLGNVIFNDKQAILIDFEEAVYTFASPTWDIAYLLQRFCYDALEDSHQQDQFLAIASEIFTFERLAIHKMMQQLAWFSLATLLYQRHINDTRAPLSEYQKFVRLEAQARELMGQ